MTWKDPDDGKLYKSMKVTCLLWEKGKHGSWQVKGYCDDYDDKDDFEPHLISVKLIQRSLLHLVQIKMWNS
jgi:hypothetical protein